MQVLFLDIDGVFITAASALYHRYHSSDNSNDHYRKWCPIAANNLRFLMSELPDLKIVISSCHRVGKDLKGCQDLLFEQDLDGSRVIGRTRPTAADHAEHGARGEEIQDYLTAHPEITKFVIVDDETDMLHLLPKLVKTDAYVGLTLHHTEKIKELLK